MRIGVQMYSLRNEIKKDGLEAVLKAVKDAGFSYVEFAGFYELSPEEAVNVFSKAGLKGMSAHVGIDGLDAALPYIEAFKLSDVYVPWMAAGDDKNDAKLAELESMVNTLSARGVGVGYHNHAHEYADGSDMVAALLSKVPGLTAQLDVFWATAAGLNPVELMKKYGKQLKCLHIKEMDSRTTDKPTEYPNVVPGEGKVGVKAVFDEAKRMGVTDFVLEVEGFSLPYAEYLKAAYSAMSEFSKS